MIVHPFRCWEHQLVQHWADLTQHSVQTLSIAGVLPCFGHLSCWGFFYKKTPLFITSAVRQKGCLPENFLHF